MCGTCPPRCCQTSFIQTNVTDNTQNCLSCTKKYKVITTYECPACHYRSQGLTCLNLDQDGYTDWCVCDSCDHQYRQVELKVHAEIKFLD